MSADQINTKRKKQKTKQSLISKDTPPREKAQKGSPKKQARTQKRNPHKIGKT
jgi:hypothetical protein